MVTYGIYLGNYACMFLLLVVDGVVSEVHWELGGLSARKHIKSPGYCKRPCVFGNMGVLLRSFVNDALGLLEARGIVKAGSRVHEHEAAESGLLIVVVLDTETSAWCMGALEFAPGIGSFDYLGVFLLSRNFVLGG